MRTAFAFLFLLPGLWGFGQDRCASADYLTAQKAAGRDAVEKLNAAEIFLQKQIPSLPASARAASEEIIRIPVVVHVLYKDALQNLSDEQIRSGIEALNRDFRRRNADTLNTPERFRSAAADVGIEFYLAISDPTGRLTKGIVRKYSGTANWLANDRIKSSAQGGDDAWDAKNYLNIWVGNLVSGSGYSSAPGGEAGKDGIVVNTGAFGTIGRSGNTSLGRIAVHEVGHWLGLKHIWGDAPCGDDGVSDTPPQSGYTVNCPSGIRFSCNNNVQGDMYMNYMDYTADACMNLFTDGQKRRMRMAFAAGGPRESLLASKGLNAPWAEGAPLPETAGAVLLFPNPANAELNLKFGEALIGKTFFIYNAAGRLVQPIQVRSFLHQLNLSPYPAGLYFIKGEGLLQKFIKL